MIRPMYRKKEMPLEQFIRGAGKGPRFYHDDTPHCSETHRDSYTNTNDDDFPYFYEPNEEHPRFQRDPDLHRGSWEDEDYGVSNWNRTVSHTMFLPSSLDPNYEFTFDLHRRSGLDD